LKNNILREKKLNFLKLLKNFEKKYSLKIKQDKASNFLEKRYREPVKNEIDFKIVA